MTPKLLVSKYEFLSLLVMKLYASKNTKKSKKLFFWRPFLGVKGGHRITIFDIIKENDLKLIGIKL